MPWLAINMAIRKKVIIALIIIAGVLFLLYACGLFTDDETKKYTTNIEDYNTEKYSLPAILFPQQIPENTTVNNFSYYEFYHEDFENYLELSFKTREEMEQYIENFLATAKDELVTSKYYIHGEDLFVVEENPHNKLYMDVIFTCFAVSRAYEDFTGYEYKKNKDCEWLSIYNFGCVSYSYDELVVIHSYLHGNFTPENNHTLQYFEKLNIGLNEDLSRIICFKNRTVKKH